MGRISTNYKYVIDIIRTGPLSLEELGDLQCFGEFCASGRARTMKIGRCVRDWYKLT